MPDDYNYIVEALIRKNDTIVERGQGVVQLSPVRYISEKEKVISEDIEVENFMVREAAYESGAMKDAGVHCADAVDGIDTGCINNEEEVWQWTMKNVNSRITSEPDYSSLQCFLR